MASPWHRPDAASGVSDLDRLRRLVDTDTLPPRKELQAQFPDRAWRDIVRRVKYLHNPQHPDTPLSFRLSDRHPTPRMPQSNKPVLSDQIHLAGPSCLVLSDCHLPFQDAALIENCVGLAVAWGIDTVVLNGDTFSLEAFSKWASDPDDTFEEELAGGEELLAYLCSSFETIKIVLGNHEGRLFGPIMQRQLKVSRFLRMMSDSPKIEISAWEWMSMDSPQGLWRFVHPTSASIIAGRVPTMIASRRFTDSHVVGAHTHMRSFGRSEDGKRWVIDSGCCCDPQRLAYSTMRVGTRPVMLQSAVIIRDGYPYILEPIMDWPAYHRMA